MTSTPFLFSFAVLWLGLAVWRELIWWHRFRRWKKAEGVVEGYNQKGDGPGGPLIGFPAGDGRRIFEAPFCLYNPAVGEVVPVLYDLSSVGAVILTPRHRWFPTVLFMFICLFLLWLGLVSK